MSWGKQTFPIMERTGWGPVLSCRGSSDGYFVIPSTIANYLATQMGKKVSADQPEFKAVEDEVRTRINRLLSIKGKKTVTTFHRDLGLTGLG